MIIVQFGYFLYTLLLYTCPIKGPKLARLFCINMWLFWFTYLTIFNHNNVLTSGIETHCVYYPYFKWKKKWSRHNFKNRSAGLNCRWEFPLRKELPGCIYELNWTSRKWKHFYLWNYFCKITIKTNIYIQQVLDLF